MALSPRFYLSFQEVCRTSLVWTNSESWLFFSSSLFCVFLVNIVVNRIEVFIESTRINKEVRILKNENFSTIYEKIFADVETPIFFYTYLKRVEKFPEKVKFGYYRADNITIREFLNNIEAGKESALRFTIPEGFTIYDIAKKIKETKLLDSEVFLKRVRDPVFIKGLTGMDIISLEGFLYPDTYFLTPEINEEEFIKKMYSNFLTKIPENFASVVAQKGLTFYQGVILSSIIQKETFVKEEYPVIASVFYNRLKRNIRLQSDPTIIYGFGG